MFLFSILPASESFGYTMSDLKYAWNSGHNSVQMSPDVSLPQFNILGHRQRLIEVTLLSLQSPIYVVGVHCLQDGPHHLCSVMNCINTDNVTIDNGIISVHHLSASASIQYHQIK